MVDQRRALLDQFPVCLVDVYFREQFCDIISFLFERRLIGLVKAAFHEIFIHVCQFRFFVLIPYECPIDEFGLHFFVHFSPSLQAPKTFFLDQGIFPFERSVLEFKGIKRRFKRLFLRFYQRIRLSLFTGRPQGIHPDLYFPDSVVDGRHAVFKQVQIPPDFHSRNLFLSFFTRGIADIVKQIAQPVLE